MSYKRRSFWCYVVSASYRAEGPFRSWADRIVARATFAWLDRRKALEQRVLQSAEADPEAQYVSQPDEYLRRASSWRHSTSYPFEQRHALVLHHVLELSVPRSPRNWKLRLKRAQSPAAWSPTHARRPLATPRGSEGKLMPDHVRASIEPRASRASGRSSGASADAVPGASRGRGSSES